MIDPFELLRRSAREGIPLKRIQLDGGLTDGRIAQPDVAPKKNAVVPKPKKGTDYAKHCEESLGFDEDDQISLDKRTSSDTRITYCTAGVLLQKLITQRTLGEFSHIIIDEVHERDNETDFLLIVIRKLMKLSGSRTKTATVPMAPYVTTLNFHGISNVHVQVRNWRYEVSPLRRRYAEMSDFKPLNSPIPLSGSKTSGSGTCSVPEQFETEQSVAPLVEPEATARPSGSGRIILSFDWLSDPTVTDVKKFRNLNFSPPCRTIVAVIETFNGLIISLVYILLISCAIAETLLIFHSEHLLRLKNDDVTISTWSPDNFPHPHTTPPHPHTVFPCQVINARSTKNLKGRCGRPSHACHCSGMPDRRTARSRIVGSGLKSKL
ncbi:unnamed protein product, partial [Nesidiocoris tenuis]